MEIWGCYLLADSTQRPAARVLKVDEECPAGITGQVRGSHAQARSDFSMPRSKICWMPHQTALHVTEDAQSQEMSLKFLNKA